MPRRDYLVSAVCRGSCDKSLVSKFPVCIFRQVPARIARASIFQTERRYARCARSRDSHIRHVGETKTGDAN